MDWYYAKQGQQQGPVDTEALRGKLASGELAGSDLVWHDGMPEWKPADTVPDLAPVPGGAQEPVPGDPAASVSAAPATPVQSTPSAAPAAVSGEQAVAQPEAGLAEGMPQGTPGLAVASLVCGILGIISSFCYGLGLFPSIAAVVCGHMQMKRYKEEGGFESGKGLTIAGLVTGYLGILGGIVWLALVVVAVVYSSQVAPPSPTMAP